MRGIEKDEKVSEFNYIDDDRKKKRAIQLWEKRTWWRNVHLDSDTLFLMMMFSFLSLPPHPDDARLDHDHEDEGKREGNWVVGSIFPCFLYIIKAHGSKLNLYSIAWAWLWSWSYFMEERNVVSMTEWRANPSSKCFVFFPCCRQPRLFFNLYLIPS